MARVWPSIVQSPRPWESTAQVAFLPKAAAISAARLVWRWGSGILTQAEGEAPLAMQRLDPSGTSSTGPCTTAPLTAGGPWQMSAAQTLVAKVAAIVVASNGSKDLGLTFAPQA